MKKILIALAVISLPLFSTGQAPAQILMADTAFTNLGGEWFRPINSYGNAAVNYDGYIYYFLMYPFELSLGKYQYYPAVYLMSNSWEMAGLRMYSNFNSDYPFLNYFGFWGELTKDITLKQYARSFIFQYMGRLWFYQNLRSIQKDSILECYAQLPPPGQPGRCNAYSNASLLFKDNNNLNYVKQAGFQSDSSQYFISGGVLNEVPYARWSLQKYSYNTATSRFDFKTSVWLDMMNDCGYAMGDMVIKRDHLNKTDYMYFCTHDDLTIWLWMLSMHAGSYQLTLLEKIINPDQLGVGDATLVQGTIQGSRPPSEIFDPANSDRIQMFIVPNTKLESNYPILFREYYSENYLLHFDGSGSIQVPSGQYPDKIDGVFQLQATYSLGPAHFSNTVSSDPSFMDGAYQRIMLLYPHQDYNELYRVLSGIGLNSDIWRPAADSSGVISDDLQSDGEYGKSIRNLWSLIGIVDGAPPCSVKWPEWDSLVHTAPWYKPEPTNLDLSLTTSSNLEITNTYEDKFTQGFSMESLNKEGLTGGVEENFAQAWKETNKSGVSQKVTWTTGFPLYEEGQEFGNFLWAVPEIKRIPFLRYPWWDGSRWTGYPDMGNFKHPVSASLQYLFRNCGMQIINDTVPLNGFPFRVTEPNAASMEGWNLSNREGILAATTTYPISNLGTATWRAPTQPGSVTFEQATNTETSTESSSTFSMEFTATAKVPKVFKLSTSLGYDINYSSEVTSTCEMGKEAKLEINDYMSDLLGGLNVSKLSIDLYWFSPQDNINYWYWDSLPAPGQKPWYIAYTAYIPTKKVKLTTPPDGAEFRIQDMLFSWETENIPDGDNTLFITDGWPVKPPSVVFYIPTGSKTIANPSDFDPKPGKTYYWSVRCIDKSGDVLWSEPRTFIYPSGTDTIKMSSTLKATVYPNPGKASDFRIMIDAVENDIISLTLTGYDGRQVSGNKTIPAANGPFNFALPFDHVKPGIYLLEIKTGTERLMKKLIVLE